MELVDGGVRNIAPLRSAIRWGATRVDVILCSPDKVEVSEGPHSLIGIASRSLDLMMNEILRADIRRAHKVNKHVLNRKVEGVPSLTKRHIEINVWQPARPVCGTLQFEPRIIREAIQYGYWTVKNAESNA